jgi:hypothetical protein
MRKPIIRLSTLLLCILVSVLAMGSSAQASEHHSRTMLDSIAAVPHLTVEGTHFGTASIDNLHNESPPQDMVLLPDSVLHLRVALTNPNEQDSFTTYVYFEIDCNGAGKTTTPYTAVTIPGQPDPSNPPPPVYVDATLAMPSGCSYDQYAAFDGVIWATTATSPNPADDQSSDPRFFKISADGTLPGATLPSWGAAGVIALWRAVDSTELAALKAEGRYTLAAGLEGKYFFPTQEQAQNFAELAANRGWGSYTITSAQIPASSLAGAETGSAAGEGAFYFIRSGLLDAVELLRIIE